MQKSKSKKHSKGKSTRTRQVSKSQNNKAAKKVKSSKIIKRKKSTAVKNQVIKKLGRFRRWEVFKTNFMLEKFKKYNVKKDVYTASRLPMDDPDYDEMALHRRRIRKKERIFNDFNEPIPMHPEFMRAMHSLRSKLSPFEELPEYGIGIDFQGKRMIARVEEGVVGSSYPLLGGYDINGHTHPTIERNIFNTMKYKFEKKNVFPNLNYKQADKARWKNILDEQLVSELTDTPTLDDAFAVRQRAKGGITQNQSPELIIGSNYNMVLYPDTRKSFDKNRDIHKFNGVARNKKVELAFSDALIRSDVSKSKTVDEYAQNVIKFEDIYHNNLKNVFSTVGVNLDYQEKDKTTVKIKK